MLNIEWRQVATLAGKEFRDRMRNRWVLAVALVFAVFSLVITYFGGAQQAKWVCARLSSPLRAW
jgi:Cu-processing system permease protein